MTSSGNRHNTSVPAQLIAKGSARNQPWPGRFGRVAARLARPVSGASLAVFRIALGLVMAMEAYCLTVSNSQIIASGETPLSTYYTGPDVTFHFPFPGVEWLPLLPPAWIHAIVVLLAVSGVTMALGLFSRISAATVFLSWTYLWCVESTRTYWQSHFYLEVLATFLMIWMPAARRYSLDAWLARRKKDRKSAPPTIPFWPIFLLRGQLVIAYFYAGVCKLNKDWLLDAVPVRWFLADPKITEPYRPYLTPGLLEWVEGVLQSSQFAYFISYTGALFDLCIGLLLLIRRTRIFAMILMVIFHAMNHFVIFDDIGMFPVLGIATATIFLDPDWPERFWRWLKSPCVAQPNWRWLAVGAVVAPPIGALLGWKLPPTSAAAGTRQGAGPPGRRGVAVAVFVVAWLAWQAILPMRHYFIAGDGRFTYEGMSFSWRLKSDARLGMPHELYIADQKIISRDPQTGEAVINWDAWHGEKLIVRITQPDRVNWIALPEIVVVLEPITGERIIYNPYSRYVGPPRPEDASRARVKYLWRDWYNRETEVEPTMKLAEALTALTEALEEFGIRGEAVDELADLLARADRLDAIRPDHSSVVEIGIQTRAVLEERLVKLAGAREAIRPILQKVDPFALYGQQPLPYPFLTIEDPRLFDATETEFQRIDRKAWHDRRYQSGPTDPLILHVGSIDASIWDMLPQAFIRDYLNSPDRAPLIRWNSGRDLTLSKLMHTSLQPFYLRRYARRVAQIWEDEYGRRPAIHAMTQMGLNGRPKQLLVDPSADLASVSVRWFGHNDWIMDLQTPRIPPEGLTKP